MVRSARKTSRGKRGGSKGATRDADFSAEAVSRRGFLALTSGVGVAGLAACFKTTSEEGLAPGGTGRQNAATFVAAKPVWPANRANEMNAFVGFRLRFGSCSPGSEVSLRITAASAYRAFLNGRFIGCGPARGPHGFARVDRWDLPAHLLANQNTLAVEVAGYNVNSYYFVKDPPFLHAEVVCGSRVLAATSAENPDCEAFDLPERLRKVQRYSFQRTFVEAYRPPADWGLWRTGGAAPGPGEALQVLPDRSLLPRRIALPELLCRQPRRWVCRGKLQRGALPGNGWRDRALTGIGPDFLGYPVSELDVVLSDELQTLGVRSREELDQPYESRETVSFPAEEYRIADFGLNLTGFVGLEIECPVPARIYLTWDEILSEGEVDFKRLSCVNAVLLELPAGLFSFETFEPYTLRFLKFACLEGKASAKGVYLREYAYPDVYLGHFAASDLRLNRLFEAGRETFRQNSVDVFMDCPSRERAGWLCDSFFTARAAASLTASAVQEKNFLENYLLPERFEHLPDGILPMCYPADHYGGVFIPNWAMWLVLQLREYAERSGDYQLVSRFEPKVRRLFQYFDRFHNSDGLLEKLESWVFIEWSKANDFVQDVNYPTNMLYASALEAAGLLFDEGRWQQRAEQVRAVIRRQSFDGEYFVDNALRRSGRLEVTRNRTEVCQYFAFYFNVASPDHYPQLWKKLRDQFGPKRMESGAFAEIHPANAFVGNMLRLELLSREGLTQQILDESIAYLLYMAERTGTLWENIDASASCNHGFASHVVHLLHRDVLGCHRIDRVNRRLDVRFSPVGLDWCEGRIPCPDGAVRITWERRGQELAYDLAVPAGYSVVIDNRSGLKLVPLNDR